MKIRYGFVTNSSSTSYTCEITGHSETFFDSASYRDFGFLMCDNEHCFLEEFVLDVECNEQDLEEWQEYDVREYQCPICSFKAFSQYELKRYLQRKYGVTDEYVFAIVKQQNKHRKKLYDSEYISYVMQQEGLTEGVLLETVKQEFNGNWKDYRDYFVGK